MDKFIIKTHSFIDVITNSSSELFVKEADKSVEVIEDILQKLLDVTNISRSENTELSDVLNVSIADRDSTSDDDWGYGITWKKGDIIIKSESDNTIPWPMQEFIENELNATRYHLG